jgi:hypothetical protein
MKTLHLTLKQPWFGMTDSGDKQEEYRELKSYWAARLLYRIPIPHGGFWSPWIDFIDGDLEFNRWKTFTGGAPVFAEFDTVTATNGYGKHRPSWTRKCLGIEIREGSTEWGAEHGKKYFVIKLGEKL